MPRYFLDTSALVKHYHTEVGTSRVRMILNEPGSEHLIARLATVEFLSGFAIKVRTGAFLSPDFHHLRGLFLADMKRRLFRPIRILNADYQQAGELIAKHGMSRQVRTLDALQLAVALRMHQAPFIEHFVCADQSSATSPPSKGWPSSTPNNPDKVPIDSMNRGAVRGADLRR